MIKQFFKWLLSFFNKKIESKSKSVDLAPTKTHEELIQDADSASCR